MRYYHDNKITDPVSFKGTVTDYMQSLKAANAFLTDRFVWKARSSKNIKQMHAGMTMIKRLSPSMLRPISMLQYLVLKTKTQGNAIALVRSSEAFLYAAGLETKFRI